MKRFLIWRILVGVIVLGALVRPASAQVLPDADATASCKSGFAASLDCSTLTVGSGTNRAITCFAWFGASSVTNVAMTWDNGGTNLALTSIASTTNTGTGVRSDLFGAVAPASGALTLHMTWTTSTFGNVYCKSWTGADQTGGTTSFPHGVNAVGADTAPTVTVTSATNNAVFAGHGLANSVTINSVDNTQVFIDNVTPRGAGNRAAGASSVTLSAALASSANWASVGTDILAAASSPKGTFQLLMGCCRH